MKSTRSTVKPAPHAVIFLLIGSATLELISNAPAQDYTTMVNNGPNSNRVNIVFLGDGYTSSQVGNTYLTHVNSMVNYFFDPSNPLNSQPFVRYKNFFNVHRIDVVSNESGADVPPEGTFRDTALHASYYGDGSTERLLTISEFHADQYINTAFASAGFSPDLRIVSVNSTRYGGAGSFSTDGYAVYAGGSSSSREIALHEVGHTFSQLADEYGGFTSTYTGPEPWQVNITKDPTGAKWVRWHGYTDPDTNILIRSTPYQGAGYYNLGIYRPSNDSKMRNLGRAFDAVSREAIILDIYNLIDPLDAWLDNSTTLVDPQNLWVDVVDPDVISLRWYVDDVLVSTALDEAFRLSDYGYGPGTYDVRAYAYDPTGFDPINGWVRMDQSLLEQSITWSVMISVPEPSTIMLAMLSLLASHRIRSRGRRGGSSAA